MTPSPAAGARSGPSLAFAAVAIVLLALNLRPGASSLGPVLAEVQRDLGMDATVAGVLTALPGLAFAIFGILAARLGLRMGLAGALALGAVAAAVGLLTRTLIASIPLFFAMSLLAFAGMAIGNVLMPAYIKAHHPGRTALLMTVYSVALSGGATLASLLAVPLAAALPGGWRAGLGVWGVTAAVTAVPWLVLAVAERRRLAASELGRPTTGGSVFAVARSPKALGLAVFFGTQSMQAYTQFGWMAQLLRDGGLAPAMAGVVTSVTVAMGVPAGLVMPAVAHRFRDGRPAVWAMSACLVAGWGGILVAPSAAPFLWALLLGLSGFAFPYALALITERTRTPRTTARVSGFVQSIGYLLAAVGPLVVGALFGFSGGRELPVMFLLGSAVLFLIGGLVAAKPGFVDDELEARSPTPAP